MRGDEQGLDAAGGFDFCGGALLLLTDVNEAVEDDGDQAAEKDEVGDGAGAEFDGANMILVRGEDRRGIRRTATGGKVEQDIDGVGRRGQKEWNQHDAGFEASAAPCTPEHDDDQTAEEKTARCQAAGT